MSEEPHNETKDQAMGYFPAEYGALLRPTGGALQARIGHDQAGCPEEFVLKYRRQRTENPYADQVHTGVRGRRSSEVNELLGGRNDA